MKKTIFGATALVFAVAMFALFLLGMARTLYAGTAYFKYETSCRGMLKQCVYDYLGSDFVINKKCHQLCPITVQVD